MTETVSSVLGTPEEWTNPLRDPRDLRLPRIAGPCSIVIFGVTGGVTEAVIRRVVDDKSNNMLHNIAYTGVRGMEGIKEASLPFGDGRLRKIGRAHV